MAPSGNPLMDAFVDFSAMVPMQVFQQLKEVDSLNRIEKLLVGGVLFRRSCQRVCKSVHVWLMKVME